MYVCPKCKLPLESHSLENYLCPSCSVEYPIHGRIPCFILDSFAPDKPDVRQVYDQIYSNHQDVWVDQGRSETFVAYFCAIARSLSQGRVLEIGCGEGSLLAALTAAEKFGIDPSIKALSRARDRSNAECAVARSEQLPFPPAFFDLVVTVGVMEHFQDPDAANREIYRVLAKNGHYIALIQTDLSIPQRFCLKLRQYIFPRFHPIQLARWVLKKIRNPIAQPFRKSYTVDGARACIEQSGLTLINLITTRTHRSVPLAGPHVVILVARK